MTENHDNSSKYNLRILSPSEVDESHIAAWSALEARAIEENAFLSPYFVLPAIRYLEEDKNPLILFVEKTAAGIPNLVGVAIFNVHKPSRKFPLPYLSLFSSIHSYLSGFLVDREYAPEVTEQIYRFIMDPKRGWHGLRVKNLAADGDFVSMRQTVESTLGIKWQRSRSWQRPVCHLNSISDTDVYVSKKAKENIQRRQRGLSKLGELEWYVCYGGSLQVSHLEELLRLEHTGWKKEEGTSLLSNPNHATFFREMSIGFQLEGRIFITELHLDRVVLSTVSNLVSGNSGFSFKIGWDISYARYSPSIINLTNYIAKRTFLPPNLDFLDSCAAPGSHMEDVWLTRRVLSDGVYALTGAGKLALSAAQVLKQVKGKFKLEKKDEES